MRLWAIGVALGMASGLATAASQSRIYHGADFVGRGFAGVAAPQDEDALFYNPAGLALSPLANPSDKEALAGAQAKAETALKEAMDDTKGKDKAKGKEGEKAAAEEKPAEEESAVDDGTGLRKIVILSPYIAASSNVATVAKAASDDVELLKTLRDEVGNPIHVAFESFSGVLYDSIGVGLIASATMDALIFKDPMFGGLETVALKANQNTGIVGGYSHLFLDGMLQAGSVVKLLQRRTIQADVNLGSIDVIRDFKASDYENKGSGYGMDLGVIANLISEGRLRLGLAVKDLGDTRFSQESGKTVAVEPILQSINFGASSHWRLPIGVGGVYFDVNDLAARIDSNGYKRMDFGADYVLAGTLGVNAGLHHGYTAGSVYLNTRFFRIDLGSYGEEVGDAIGTRPSRRYFMRLMSSL